MDTVIIIPARYESSRFPGKPLHNIAGKTLIRRVWEKCAKAVDERNVYVATDNVKIQEHCHNNGIRTIMTSSRFLTGSDRVACAYGKIKTRYDIVINVQGDEPLISPSDITKIICAFNYNDGYDVFCGMCNGGINEWNNKNVIKIAVDGYDNLLYASRSKIPMSKNGEFNGCMKQVCIYGFTPRMLEKIFGANRKTPLEGIEDIEILRVIERGYDVKMVKVSDGSVGVDTIDDANYVEKLIQGEL
ncbi:MAG: 3-deoxy-manno-octulosonate cytidylyltransferase [Chloroflexi bacterium]|nr:MAG: 3-deoxy-manno-octulosonate cytidylyltransferase [Chloroflexota bacterium]